MRTSTAFWPFRQEDEARLLEAARCMDDNECNTVIAAARGVAGKPFEHILSGINEAGKQFGGNVRQTYGNSGEW
jgi:hypothetical protein